MCKFCRYFCNGFCTIDKGAPDNGITCSFFRILVK